MDQEQREKWDFMLNQPLPGREPSPAQLQRESDDFMQALGAFNAGAL